MFLLSFLLRQELFTFFCNFFYSVFIEELTREDLKTSKLTLIYVFSLCCLDTVIIIVIAIIYYYCYYPGY